MRTLFVLCILLLESAYGADINVSGTANIGTITFRGVPEFTVEPTNANFAIGAATNLYVNAVGAATLDYYWRWTNDTKIWSTSNTLNWESFDTTNTSDYYCIVSNRYGFDTSATGRVASASTYEIYDTFTAADGTDLNGHMTTAEGASGSYPWVSNPAWWYISGNVVTNIGNTGNPYVNHVMPFADYTATVDVTPVANTAVCLAIRCNPGSSSTNGYFVYWYPGVAARAYVKTNGVATSLRSGWAIALGGITNMSVSASGSVITWRTNGVTLLSTTESSISGPGYVGIGGNWSGSSAAATAYDNLKVTIP